MRLAQERGLLHQTELSKAQFWALLYWVYLKRRTEREDKHAELIQQTFNLNPERWEQLYRKELLKELGIKDEDEEDQEEDGFKEQGLPLQDSDYDAIDQFLEQQENNAIKRWIAAGQLPPDYVSAGGRRV